MATSDDYRDYVLELLRDVPETRVRKMMGEYLLYVEDKLVGGIYDDRLLVKDVPAARARLSLEAVPYEGAKPMLLVESENPQVVAELAAAMLPELPDPKPRAKRTPRKKERA